MFDIRKIEDYKRSRPSANGLLESVAEACRIYAHAVSCITISIRRMEGIIAHVAETMYLIIIFFLWSIPILYTQISSVEDHRTKQFIGMVLSALINWLDCGLEGLIRGTSLISSPDNKLLECRIALYGLLQMCVVFSSVFIQI